MSSLLDIFLKKLGLKGAEELDDKPNSDGSPTERQKFQEWRRILSKSDTLTLDEIKNYCQVQIGIIENHWKNFDLAKEKKADLIPIHTLYKTLEQAISAPKAEREILEAYLNQLIQ